MRLSEEEKESIISAAVEAFDGPTAVYLFGSKADDTRKGGDIDLLVLSDTIPDRSKIRIFKILLEEKLGERRIDVVSAAFDSEDTFVTLIKQEGIMLWEKK